MEDTTAMSPRRQSIDQVDRSARHPGRLPPTHSCTAPGTHAQRRPWEGKMPELSEAQAQYVVQENDIGSQCVVQASHVGTALRASGFIRNVRYVRQ